MAEAKQSAVKEVFEDPNAGRLDFFNARALAYSISGETAKLEKLVDQWRDQAKSTRGEAHARMVLNAGVGLWIMRRFAEAVKALGALGNHAEASFFRALCLTEIARYGDAEKAFTAAMKAGQEEFACAMAIAEARRRSGNREGAEELLKQYEDDYNQEAELHFQKGRCLEDLMDYEAAMEAYERAAELNPQHSGALFRLAYWHDLRGNDELAIDYYEKASEAPPGYANVLLNLGLLYEDNGQYEKALQTYQRVATAFPTHPRARMYSKDARGSINMYYDEVTERREHRTAVLLHTPLSDFELSARSRACLEKMNIRTLGDLAQHTDDELVRSKNFGETSLSELRVLLQSKGLHFGFGRIDEAPVEALAAPQESGAPGKAVAELELSIRSQKCVETLEIRTVSDLTLKTERELLQCQNFGQTSLDEIKSKLADLGLALAPAK